MLKYRILIADDHEIVRHGLRALLEAHPGWEVCAEATDGWQAVKMAAETKPDVVAMFHIGVKTEYHCVLFL